MTARGDSSGERSNGRDDAALDALFADYVAALDARDHRADAALGAELTARFAMRAGELAGPFLRRAQFLQVLASLGTHARESSFGADRRALDAPTPRRIGRYEVLERLGDGGGARVLRARDPLLQRHVALKLLEIDAPADGRARDFLLNDARALGRLEHPAIVRVLDVDSDGGHDFVVMEYVRGPSLAAVIAALAEDREPRSGPAPRHSPDLARAVERLRGIPERVRLVERLATALDECHRRGVVHRDIKPSNILVRPDGEPVLIDFGIAHFSGSGGHVTQNLVGTPAYLAPEQVASSRTGASPESDQFALGVVLYELLTLVQPFARPTREQTLAAVLAADVRPPSAASPAVTRDLERLCLHALERSPAARYASLAAFARDLAAARELRPLSLPDPRPLAPLLRRLRRHRRRLAGVSAMVVLVGLSVVAGDRMVRAGAVRAGLEPHTRARPWNLLELHVAAEELTEAERTLHELTSDAIGRWIAADLPDRLDDARRAWSSELARLIDDDAASHAAQGIAMNWGMWRALLDRDEQLLPLGVANLRDRQRGRLHLPPGVPATRARLELHSAQGPGGISSGLRELPFDTQLQSGSYRLTLLDADGTGVERQVEFRVDPGDVDRPARRLRVPPVRPGFHEDALALAPRRLLVDGVLARRAIPVDLPATWVSRDVVRVRDLAPWIAAQRAGALSAVFDALDPDAPALLAAEQAAAFAAWCGLRLPTALEWYAAALEDGFVRADADRLPSDHAGMMDGEFLGGAWIENLRTARIVEYERFEDIPKDPTRTAPEHWTVAPYGRPDGTSVRMPAPVRAASERFGTRAETDLLRQAYRTTAFRLATHVPPPAP